MKVGHFPFPLVELLDSELFNDELDVVKKKFEYQMDDIYGTH